MTQVSKSNQTSKTPEELGFVPYLRKHSRELREFKDLTEGHDFQIVAFKALSEGESIPCARCGYQIRNFVELKRDDGKQMKISRGCLKTIQTLFKEHITEEKKAKVEHSKSQPKQG